MKDVDRALAVRRIHLADVSLRALARDLNRSPTLLRRLNQAAQTSTLHLIRARTEKISTRELVRRAKAAKDQRAAKQQETNEHTR